MCTTTKNKKGERNVRSQALSSLSVLKSVADTPTEGREHSSHLLGARLQRLASATPRKATPAPSSPPRTEHTVTSAVCHRTGTLTYFPTSSYCTLSSCERKNKDSSSTRGCLPKNREAKRRIPVTKSSFRG